jgi:hypothetical protein
VGDPEFQRILIRFVLLGGAIFAVGAGTLFVAFRAYGTNDSKGRATILVGALLVFVLLMCVLLLRLSFAKS